MVAKAPLECVRLAAAFLAGGSHGPPRRTRPSPPDEAEGSSGRGRPLTALLVSARESEESGGKPHALQRGLGDHQRALTMEESDAEEASDRFSPVRLRRLREP